jgi:hypothetical protein
VKQRVAGFTCYVTVKQRAGGAIRAAGNTNVTDFDAGFLVGILVGEGHFGGDGRQPHVTLRMHTDHEPLFRWIERTYPGGRLYGPYHHSGRSYYQWMARGPYLRDVLVPLLDAWLTPDLDQRAYDRYIGMKSRYARALRPPQRDTS